MTGSTSRRKGATFQRAVRSYLAEHATGEVRARAPGEDGDDLAAYIHGVPLSVEVKNQQRIDLAGWVDQAVGNAGYEVPVVIAKRRGRGDVGDSYAVLPLDWFIDALGIAYAAGKRDGAK